MKKIIILSLFLGGVTSLFAKDISIRVVNENDVPLTIMCGTISSKDNSYSDDEIFQKMKDLKIASIGKPLAPNKKTQFNKTDLSGSSILIIVGMYKGGGRTNIFRYRVKDIEKELDITFENVKTNKSNSSYIKIAEGLKNTEDIGSYVLNTNNQITGSFIFFNISAEKLGEVYLANPSPKVEVDMGKKASNTVDDLLLKTAVEPFMNVNGKLVRAVPQNDSDAYNEVIIPGFEKSAEIFGDNNYKFLTWKISGSSRINVKNKVKSFLPLYSTCGETERKSIMDKFIRDISENGSSDYHLFFITSVHQTDSLQIIDDGMKKIEAYEQIIENDLITPSGNFRLDGSTKNVYHLTNTINDVKAIDITPLFYYISIVQGKFTNNLSSASNCVDVYKALGSFIELPVLDDNTLSISSPANTISKIKEVVSDPKILTSIEAKLLVQTPGSISLNAVKATQVKLDTKKK